MKMTMVNSGLKKLNDETFVKNNYPQIELPDPFRYSVFHVYIDLHRLLVGRGAAARHSAGPAAPTLCQH